MTPGSGRFRAYVAKWSRQREAIVLTTPILQRPTYHGSGAVSFSTKGEYGVRLMVQLARHYGTGPASLAGIAAEEDLPRGGYGLARPPKDIAMSDVLRALEGPIAPMF